MSYPGTHTPRKGESKKAQRYTVPTRRAAVLLNNLHNLLRYDTQE